jgi:hypothetical protein
LPPYEINRPVSKFLEDFFSQKNVHEKMEKIILSAAFIFAVSRSKTDRVESISTRRYISTAVMISKSNFSRNFKH